MLDMGFIHDIKRILPKLPKEKQTLFFSATMPDSIIALTKSLLKNPVKIYITPKSSTVDSIKQIIYFVEKKEKSQLLISILQKAEDQSVLIFSRTKHNADKIVAKDPSSNKDIFSPFFNVSAMAPITAFTALAASTLLVPFFSATFSINSRLFIVNGFKLINRVYCHISRNRTR